MLSSLQAWNPNIPLNVSMLRKAEGSRGKVTWNEELEDEYQKEDHVNENKKRLPLVIDGAKTLGTGFILIQYLNDAKPEKGVNIIHLGSGLLDQEKDYSPVEAEAIALDRAITACHHWLYY